MGLDLTLIKIGIIGNGRIAGRFIKEAGFVEGAKVCGVYNPHIESAESFAEKYGITCFKSLDEMYEICDAVYVATPHQYHYDYVKGALAAGCHVLCEKPICLKSDEAKELYEMANRHRLVLLEGIKTAYCPGFKHLLSVAGSGIIGEISYVEACFTKLENKTFRELTDTVYGGSLLELGSYCILPVLKFLGMDFEGFFFETINNELGIDIFTKASFKYENKLATSTCGLGVKSEGRLLIAGTKGYILVPAPWWKTTAFEVHFEDAGRVEKYEDVFEGDGLRYEIGEFLKLIRGELKANQALTDEESACIAGIMEEFLSRSRREIK